MSSKPPKIGHCDICDSDSLHLQNLPCLNHYACRSCAAKIACLGPSIPERDIHTCPICIVTAAEDVEPYTEDCDPLGIGFTGQFGNPRPNTPISTVPKQQSQETFLNLASTRLLNGPVDDTQSKPTFASEPKQHATNGEQVCVDKVVHRSPDAKIHGTSYTNTKFFPNPLPAWSASKSDSFDSLGSWRSSPASLTQGDITDMGIVTLPQRPNVGLHTQGAVLRTEGTLSPRSLLKAQHAIHCKLRKESDSTFHGLQSQSPTQIGLNINVLDPDDTLELKDDNPAARYLFEDNTSENKQDEYRITGAPRKKSLRGMAGPIIPGGVQKSDVPKRSVVAILKDRKSKGSQQLSNRPLLANYVHTDKQSKQTEENPDLTGLNDEIEQLLNDNSKPSGHSGIPATVIASQLRSTMLKPLKRNAKGQQIPTLMSRYSTPDDDNILRKPSPNVQNLPSLGTTTSNKRKFKPRAVRLGWGQFSDDDDDYDATAANTKVTFVEELQGNTGPREVWTQRRQDTPFQTAGVSSDEDEEEEIERCTSPIKRVRGSGRGWVRPSPSNSDDSLERCSMITRPEPEDFWDI